MNLPVLELDAVATKILSVTPKKQGKKDDSPLIVDLKIEMDIRATELLAYFHPVLRDFLFCHTGTRFGSELKNFKWDTTYNNLELHLAGLVLPAYTLSNFVIWPYAKTNEVDADFRDALTVYAKAVIKIVKDEKSPLGLLSEYINMPLDLTVKPLSIDLAAEDRKAREEEAKLKKQNKTIITLPGGKKVPMPFTAKAIEDTLDIKLSQTEAEEIQTLADLFEKPTNKKKNH